MRVVFVYPEVYDMARFREQRREFPPFGVLYLAAAVREAGHEVAIERAYHGREPLDLRSYDAVGFSLASSATYGLMLETRTTAQYAPEALIMVGGVHANFYGLQTYTDFSADVVSVGESDETVLQLLERADTRDFAGIPGLIYRDASGSLQQTPARPVARDISHLPLPARDLLPVEDFIMLDRLAGRPIRMAHVMFSRGCPFPCTFCAAGQTRIQYRNGASARRELVHLQATYDIGGFAIVDDNFIVNKPAVRDICNSIEDLGLLWSALSRVDTVDEALLQDLARSGCIEVKFGVESGSERLLKAMKKNTTREQIKRAIKQAAAVGIEAKAFIIHGYPGEDESTTAETISLLEELGSDLARVSLFRFVPLPGTSLYDDPLNLAKLRGRHLDPTWDGDWSRFHIHHNQQHWWGSDADFEVVERGFATLSAYVADRWGPQV